MSHRFFNLRFSAALLLFLFATGCSAPTAVSKAASSQTSISTPPSKAAVSASSSSLPVPDSSPALVPPAPSDSFSLSDFSPLKKYVVATLYCDLKVPSAPHTIRGSFDFNGDGRKEAVTLDFSSEPDTGKKSTLAVGGTSASLSLCGVAGLYVVSLLGYDRELALVDYGMDNIVTTTFFRYDTETLTQQIELPGGIEADPREGYNIPEYNFQILSDGQKGHLIPRYGVMRYVSPNVALAAEKFDGIAFSKIPVSLSGSVGKTYSLAMNAAPYFQEGSTDVSNPELCCDDKDKIRLTKGQKITLLSINPSVGELACSGVRLADGRKGLLYFFLHP